MSHPPTGETDPSGPSTPRRPTVAHWMLLLLAAFFVGPMYASNIWGYLQSRRYLTEAAFTNVRNVAALEASETREFVRSAEGLVGSVVAGNHYMFQVIRLLRGSGQERELLSGALHGHLAAKAAEGAVFREFLVMAPSGRLLASSEPGRALDSDMSADRCFQTGIAGISIGGFESRDGSGDHHGNDSSPDHSASNGDEHHAPPVLVVAGPIHETDGSLLGVFCGRFSFEVHRKMMLDTRDRTRQATLYLLDERDEVVCGSFEDLRAAPYGNKLPWLDTIRVTADQATEGKRRASDGSEIMVAYSPIPELGWSVVAEVPVVRALADLERLKWQAVTGSGVLAFIFILAGFLSWRTFVAPIQALSRASERMASGDPGETVSPGGPREIAELASSFNRMSLTLQESHETLESKVAERTQALRESREFLELLLDTIDQRVVVVDSDHEIIKANAAAVRMHGHDLVGSRWWEVFEGLDEPPENAPILHTLVTGEMASDERSQNTVRGQEPIYVETYPILDATGRVASVVEIGRVVTAEKKLQMQMVYQEKMAAFGQLAAGIAHEIGNPLAAIESQLQLAQHDPNRVEQTLEVVRNQVGRMDRMLRRLVDFTRRKRGEAMLTSVSQIVEDVAQLMEHDPRSRGVSIECRLGENIPGIRIKEDDLMQVLLNLGLNALDAVEKDGTVEFSTTIDGRELVIRVRDDGCGVPKEAVGSLFDPFFTTKGPGKGTGLGLFVSKGIIEGIGGVLALETTGPAGTTFAIRLSLDDGGSDGDGI